MTKIREIEAYPLCWPEGWRRTLNHLRKGDYAAVDKGRRPVLWRRWRDRLAIYGLVLAAAGWLGFGGFGQWAGGTINRPPTMTIGVPSNSARAVGSSPAWFKRSVGIPSIITAVPCFNWSSALNNSTSGATVFGRAPSKPNGSNIMMLKLWTAGSRESMTPLIPADRKAFFNSMANHRDSASVSNAILISGNCSLKDVIKSHCRWLSMRGLNWASSWARAKSASAARTWYSANCLSPAILALWPKYTSPHTPPTINRTATMAAMVSAPWNQMTALTTSRNRPAIRMYAEIWARRLFVSYTRPESPAPSAIAYIVPFGAAGRRRASKHAAIQAALLLAVLIFGLGALIWMLLK